MLIFQFAMLVYQRVISFSMVKTLEINGHATGTDWLEATIYKAYVLGICKGISQLYAHNMFAG